MRVSLAVVLLAALPGCMDFSVDHYCAQYPDRCSMTVRAIYPDRGRAEGGTPVRVQGMGFEQGTTVTLCGIPAQVSQILATEVYFVTPPNERGTTCEVVFHNGSQTVTLPAAFLYPPNPILESVQPSPASSDGDQITVRGQFLAPLRSVKIDGAYVTQFGGTDTQLQFSVGAHAEGPATLEVTTDFGTTVDDKLLRFAKIWTASPPFSGGQVLALAANPLRAGELWVSVAGSGISRLDPGTGSWMWETAFVDGDVDRIAMAGSVPYLATPNYVWSRQGPGSWYGYSMSQHLRALAAGNSGVWDLWSTGLCLHGSTRDCDNTGVEAAWSGGAVAVGSSGAYASGTSGAVYRTPGHAATPLCQEIGRVSAIAVEPGPPEAAYFAAGGDLYRATSPSGPCQLVWSGVRIAALDAALSGRGLLLMTDRAVYETLDSGATWNPLSLGADAWPVAMAHDGAGAKYVALASGQIQKLPAGTAIPPLSSLAVKQIEVDPNDASHVVAIAGWQLFQSRDTAASWTPVPMADVPKPSSVFFGRTPGTIFAATPLGVRASRDSGASWQLLGDPQPIADLAESFDGVLLAGLERRVLWSSDGGATWTPDPAWSAMSPIECVGFLATPPLALVAADSVRSATPPGGSWSGFASLGTSRCRRLRTGPGAGVVMVLGLTNGSVALSRNGGTAWDTLALSYLRDARASASDLYTASVSGGLMRTPLSSLSAPVWQPLEVPSSVEVGAVALDPSNPSVLYIGSRTGQVFRSTVLGR